MSKHLKKWDITVLPARACTICWEHFTPRYRTKGFECSNRCYKAAAYNKTGHVLRSPEARKRDTEWMREARRKNPGQALKTERSARTRARARLGDEGYKRRQRNYNLKKCYGITADEYDFMLNRQDNKCAICRCVQEGKKSFHVDHNHSTGKIRGLLCHKCNQGMMAVDAAEDWCERAREYAEVHTLKEQNR